MPGFLFSFSELGNNSVSWGSCCAYRDVGDRFFQFGRPSMKLQCWQQYRKTFYVILPSIQNAFCIGNTAYHHLIIAINVSKVKMHRVKRPLLLVDILANQGHIGLLVKCSTMSHRCRLAGWLAVNPKLFHSAGIPLNLECGLLHPTNLQELCCSSAHAELIIPHWLTISFFFRVVTSFPADKFCNICMLVEDIAKVILLCMGAGMSPLCQGPQ